MTSVILPCKRRGFPGGGRGSRCKCPKATRGSGRGHAGGGGWREVVCGPLGLRPGSSAGLGGEFWAELGPGGETGPEGKASTPLGRQEGRGDGLSP